MDFVSDTNAVLSAVSAAVLSLANFRSQSIKEIADHDLFTPNSDLYDSVWCDQDKIISLIENVNRLFANWKDDIKKTVKQTLTTLKEAEAEFAHASPNEKSRFCYLYGKALNALPQDLMDEAEEEKGNGWTSQAIQWLTRALKFNPQCADAWCELGESCWRQGNADEAVRHFRQTLKLVPNHVDALCELSMALRQIPASETNSTGSVESDESPLSESVRLAHEAVRHEPTNGRAWTVLGNALLTMFFESFAPVTPPPMSSRTAAKHRNDEPSATTTQSASQLIMSRCIAAYALAIKDKSAVLEQSLHYNRGVAWHYQDKFADSLRSWLRAMCLDPEWSAPRINAVRLTQFLIHAYHAVEQIKSKSLDDQDTTDSTQSREMGKSTRVAVASTGMPHLPDLVTPLLPCLSLLNDGNQSTCTDDSSSSETKRLNNNQCSSISLLLGPYFTSLKCDLAAGLSGASLKKNKANRSKHFKYLQNAQVPGSSHLQFSLFNDLKIGSNRDKLCVGRVVCRLPSDTELALNLLLVDAHSTPLSVRLYNIGKDLGPDRKDILAIPHPFMEQCDVKLCLLRAVLMATSSFGEKDPQVDTLLDKLDGLKASADDQLSFRVLRIPIPDVLVVNGQPVGASWTAAPVLKNIFFTAV
ncbi:unnamed protein product [Dicrocoelium dendriticum]|nr:unnamed protein product [Dicrocoelium dendriticum]